MSHENHKKQVKQSSLLPSIVSIFRGMEILFQISCNMLTLMTSFLFLIFPSLFGILSWLQKQSIFWQDCWLANVSLFSNSLLRYSTSSRPTSIVPKIISSSTHRFIHIAMWLSEIWFGTKLHLHLCSKMISSQIFWSRALRRRWKRKSPWDSWVVSIQ